MIQDELMFHLKCFMPVFRFQISMKQHQRKQRDSPALYKDLCELLKCLRSHYWQYFDLRVFMYWPGGCLWKQKCRFPVQHDCMGLSSQMIFSNAKQQYVASKTEEKQLKMIDKKVGWITDQLEKRQTECSAFWGAFGKLLCFVAKPVESHPETSD